MATFRSSEGFRFLCEAPSRTGLTVIFTNYINGLNALMFAIAVVEQLNMTKVQLPNQTLMGLST